MRRRFSKAAYSRWCMRNESIPNLDAYSFIDAFNEMSDEEFEQAKKDDRLGKWIDSLEITAK